MRVDASGKLHAGPEAATAGAGRTPLNISIFVVAYSPINAAVHYDRKGIKIGLFVVGAAGASLGGGMQGGQVVGSMGERGVKRGGTGRNGSGNGGRQDSVRVGRERPAGHGGSGERGREIIPPVAGGRSDGTAVAVHQRAGVAETGRVRLRRRGERGTREGER